jgi:ribose transport system substrate-binding protein
MVKMLDEIKKAGDGWQPKAAEVPAVLVAKDSVEQFIKDHPEALK